MIQTKTLEEFVAVTKKNKEAYIAVEDVSGSRLEVYGCADKERSQRVRLVLSNDMQSTFFYNAVELAKKLKRLEYDVNIGASTPNNPWHHVFSVEEAEQHLYGRPDEEYPNDALVLESGFRLHQVQHLKDSQFDNDTTKKWK